MTLSSDTETSSTAHVDSVVHDVVTWVAEVLEEPSVDSQNNFLDLGGHSMLALELNRHVTGKYDVELDMQTLFEGTLVEVAEKLVSAHAEKNG